MRLEMLMIACLVSLVLWAFAIGVLAVGFGMGWWPL